MKRLLLILVISAFAFQANATGIIVLEGHYQGKNLYVQNPFAGSGVGFCTFEVTINGEVTTDEVNSSAFEIDFTIRQLNIGDPVIVKIKHKDDCKPKVLNPEVLKPKSTFEIVSIDVSENGNLDWTTKNETGKLTYTVEQFRWNKWVKVGEVDGYGTPIKNSYNFKVTPHSGENKFRVKQIDYSGNPRYSTASRFNSFVEEVTFSPKKAKKEILFTGETLFEVFDSFGNIVKRGFGVNINVENLKKGIYYINYDNSSGDTFVKK